MVMKTKIEEFCGGWIVRVRLLPFIRVSIKEYGNDGLSYPAPHIFWTLEEAEEEAESWAAF
jgi:hypothetical protein